MFANLQIIMSSKSFKLARKNAAQQREVLIELQELEKGFERSEKMITELKAEMEEVNAKHTTRNSTQEDIAYLEDLLRCARKKLAWEKQMERLRKRTPEILQMVSAVINNSQHPAGDQMRAAILQSLERMKVGMERLEQAKVE